MKKQFKIEVYRDGEWVHQDSADSIKEAYMLASSLCHQTREEEIRVVYPTGFVDEVRQLDFESHGSQGYRFSVIIMNIIAMILFLGWLYFRGL